MEGSESQGVLVTVKGVLGTVNVVLPEWKDPEERYDRTYTPVTPASRTVTGADDKIAPETDIATWSITDWSRGEGDLRWKDRGRYNTATGVGPASDGSGVTVGHDWTVATQQAEVVARGGGRLVSMRDMNDKIYTWGGSSWSALWNIGGTAGRDAVSAAAVNTTSWYVVDTSGDIRRVQSGSTSAHNTAKNWDYVVGYDGVLYGLVDVDLYDVHLTSSNTQTVVYDASSASILTDTRVKLLSTSDVGPIWVVPKDDGTTLFMEYNVADSAGYVSHELPKDCHVYDVAFHDGIYFAAFRYADSHSSTGDAYLHYKKGEARGVAGPFRADATTASTRVAIAGIVGDRIYIAYQQKVWAYDLSSGGISLVADLSGSAIGDIYGAVSYGSKVFCAGTANYGVVNTRGYLANTAQTLSTGLHDYGYLGLPKLIHTVTVNTEDVLAATDKVEVGYSVDGGSTTWLANSFTAGAASYQWTVSTNASSVIGTEIEWHLRHTTTSTSVAAKVISLHSDASGAKSRINFTIAVDLGESSVNDGSDVMSALHALKTSHAVVQWSDPYEVDEYTAPQTFDVRVKEVSTPELSTDGFTSAVVRFQTVGVVG